MRNLILFVKTYYNFFVFLLLQIICFSFIFSNSSVQQSSYINSSRAIAGKLYKQKMRLVDFVHLKKVNQNLLAENAKLKYELGIQTKKNHLKDTSYQKVIASDSLTQTTHYHYIPVKVLNNTIDQKRNYITLNAGSKQGIKRNMAVISDKGIVGKISHVSENYSVALSLLSDKFTVSAMLSDGTVGKLAWDGEDPSLALLNGIPQSVKVKPLDSVFTSGYSIFPEGILIGRAAKSNKGMSYKIWLSTNFYNLHYVYIVEDITNIERIQLEDTTQVEATL